MARVKHSSRRLFLGIAFVSVMAGSGALFGSMGGLMLALLGHAVFLTDDGTVAVMVICGVLGVAIATLWSVLLVVRPEAHVLAWQQATTVQQTPPGT